MTKASEGPVALVGYMGSGKSTVGRDLAEKLGWAFVDLDEEVERRAGKSIPEVFAASGEEGFRDLEAGALREVLGRGGRFVVSCGGGVVGRAENRRLLAKVPTVFLEEDLDVLYKRTRAAGRPLRGGSREEFLERYAGRKEHYREVAALTVRGGRGRAEVSEEVLSWLAG